MEISPKRDTAGVTPVTRDMSREVTPVTPALPTPILTALVEGAITNTVHVLGPNGGRSRGRKPPKRASSSSAIAPRVIGARPDRGSKKLFPVTNTRQVCMSLPVEDLAAIDRAARVAQLSRSAFVRLAVSQIARDIVDNGKRLDVTVTAKLAGGAA